MNDRTGYEFDGLSLRRLPKGTAVAIKRRARPRGGLAWFIRLGPQNTVGCGIVTRCRKVRDHYRLTIARRNLCLVPSLGEIRSGDQLTVDGATGRVTRLVPIGTAASAPDKNGNVVVILGGAQ